MRWAANETWNARKENHPRFGFLCSGISKAGSFLKLRDLLYDLRVEVGLWSLSDTSNEVINTLSDCFTDRVGIGVSIPNFMFEAGSFFLQLSLPAYRTSRSAPGRVQEAQGLVRRMEREHLAMDMVSYGGASKLGGGGGLVGWLVGGFGLVWVGLVWFGLGWVGLLVGWLAGGWAGGWVGQSVGQSVGWLGGGLLAMFVLFVAFPQKSNALSPQQRCGHPKACRSPGAFVDRGVILGAVKPTVGLRHGFLWAPMSPISGARIRRAAAGARPRQGRGGGAAGAAAHGRGAPGAQRRVLPDGASRRRGT